MVKSEKFVSTFSPIFKEVDGGQFKIRVYWGVPGSRGVLGRVDFQISRRILTVSSEIPGPLLDHLFSAIKSGHLSFL